jgi:hypothetical protein
MSSWCNRDIPRKRDITHIPEEFRPTVVPRCARSEVLLSETFQKKEIKETKGVNEIIYPEYAEYANVPAPHYSIQRIETRSNQNAVELRFNDKTYVFVILRNLRSVADNMLWISSYNSIRKFYTNKIVIIDDNSTINTVNGKLINCEVIKSMHNGAGEVLPYYYFLKEKWADSMIFIHDSMSLSRAFTIKELDTAVRFHWHFDNKKAWGPKEYEKLISYASLFKDCDPLIEYIKLYDELYSCFGGTSIIDLSIVQLLEEKYELFTRLITIIRSRKDREIFERLFSKVLNYEELIDNKDCSSFGDIFSYPNAFETGRTFETSLHEVKSANYNTAIIKVWVGR